MEVYLWGHTLIVANDDGTIKEYDKEWDNDDHEQIRKDFEEACNYWEQSCESVALVSIEKIKDIYFDGYDEQWVEVIEHEKLIEFECPFKPFE